MFSQKQEDPGEWAALPAEPYDRDDADLLPEQSTADPFGLGFGAGGVSVSVEVTGAGGSAAVSSVAIPMPETDAEIPTEK